jgi:2-keto-4-pentenoate hydratase/2-oxohepta-3-ene-1,7-dioic acid hydratase in catechol pathway
MRLATFKAAGRTSYGIVTDQGIVDLGKRLGGDLKNFLHQRSVGEAKKFASEKPDVQTSEVEWLPVIPNPGKIICVGLNYEEHRAETGRDKTEQPALFVRVAESQTGHLQPMLCPRESTMFDYEAEIAIVIGRSGRRISQKDSWNHIAGFSCYNDGSVRDWQRHTVQWTAGKNFVGTGPFGPWMVTADEIPPGTVMTLTCRLNGTEMQRATTDMMIFKFPKLIEYISAFTPLEPGDVIVTGTPGGVGSRRTPPVWMKPGDTVEIEIDKVGVLRNKIVQD